MSQSKNKTEKKEGTTEVEDARSSSEKCGLICYVYRIVIA